MLEDTVVITYSNTEIHRQYQKEFGKLYKNNFARHVDFTEEDIKATQFWKDNLQMFQYKKYGGYFLWKPYIILKTLELYPESRVLYCDVNLRFKNFKQFENSYNQLMPTQSAYFVRHEHFLNKEWTKRDCFILMNADDDRYWNSNQIWSSLMGFGRDERILKALEDYMEYCKNPQIITEQPNIMNKKNLTEFREHRWEQSVMSILVQKYGYLGISDTQAMNWVTKEYSPELLQFKREINQSV